MNKYKRAMKQKEETKHVKRMLIIMSVLILFGIALFLGTSYALFSVLVEGNQSISITTKTLEVKLHDGEYIREDSRGTMTDKQGKNTKPYRFTITNTGTMEAYYKLYLIEEGPIGEKELVNTYYLKYELKGDDGSQQEGRIGELEQFYQNKMIGIGETITYELRIWLDKDTPNSEQEKSYQSKVAVDANQLNYPNPPVLADNMIPVVYDEEEKRWEKADVEQGWYNYNNQEWALISYLTQSKYGKYGNLLYSDANKEMYINSYSGFITGCSSGVPSATSASSCGNAYDVMTDRGSGQGYAGAGASTTGNITGIYDMSGGAWEYTMSVYNKMSGNTEVNNSGYAGKITNGSSIGGRTWPTDKYYDLYTSDNPLTACNGASCKGHALNETAGWYSDSSIIVTAERPWLVRCGDYSNATVAGVFHYSLYYGSGHLYNSFRQVLAPVRNA